MMNSARTLLTGLTLLLAAEWLRRGLAALWGMPRLPDLSPRGPQDLPGESSLGDGPHLAVVIPARDEAGAIEACLRSLVQSTGLRLQLIPVNDRSADGTGERLEAIAREARASNISHQIEVLHIRHLPDGWLGKPHAMAVGAQRATAPWILFTDGDVIFAPDALARAIREADRTAADHMVLAPTLILRSAGERAVLGAMQALALWMVRMWKVSDPKAGDAMGAGGFNMIRSGVYREMGGFEALRMEVLEDIFLAKRVKRRGYAQRFVLGRDLVRLRWFEGTFAVVRLVEKNGFAVTRFRTGRHLMLCLFFLLNAVCPVAGILSGGWAMGAGFAAYAGIAAAYHASRRLTGVSAWHTVTFAPAAVLVAWAFLRSMLLAQARGGVVWRGTIYPLSQLRLAAQAGERGK